MSISKTGLAFCSPECSKKAEITLRNIKNGLKPEGILDVMFDF